MRKATKDDWAGRYPKTNCMWMHYLADTLLNKKSVTCSKEEHRRLSGFRRRAMQYNNCNELIWDELFAGMWETQEDMQSAVPPPKK